MTLSAGLVGAFLAAPAAPTYRGMLARIVAEGAAGLDDLSDDASLDIRAQGRSRRVGWIVEDTLQTLPEAARRTLEYAAQFPPDGVVLDWLRLLVAHDFPELAADQVKPGYADAWEALVERLNARRLLPINERQEGELATARLHRLIGEHLEAASGEESWAERRNRPYSYCMSDWALLRTELALRAAAVPPHARPR